MKFVRINTIDLFCVLIAVLMWFIMLSNDAKRADSKFIKTINIVGYHGEKQVFTAAMLSGLIVIWINEATFRSLSNMQLFDYLLMGKSLVPRSAYIDSTSFKSNNSAYSSAAARKNKAGQNITPTTSFPKKQQEINHGKNKDDFQTSSYLSTKSTKKDESKNSTIITAKATTNNSTNISTDNFSVTISSQNVTSTTLELPINLLKQSLETHEATSQNEPKLKISAKSKKNPKKSKKKHVTGSKINENKADDDKDEPLLTTMTKPPTFELSTESTQSTRKPLSVPDTKSESVETPRELHIFRNSVDNANYQMTTSDAVIESNENRRNKKSSTSDHENPSAVQESNQDASVATAFVSTTVSHITGWLQMDLFSTNTSNSKRTLRKSSMKWKEHEENVSKEGNEETISIESHAIMVGKGTEKKTTAMIKKKRTGTVGKLLPGGVPFVNEINTVYESAAATNHNPIATTEQPITIDKVKVSGEEATVSAEAHPIKITVGKGKGKKATYNMKNRRVGNVDKLFGLEPQLINENLPVDESLRHHDDRSAVITDTPVTISEEKNLKVTAITKKRRTGKMVGVEAHLENENLAADESVVHSDHSVATTEKPSVINKENIFKEGNEVTIDAEAHTTVTISKGTAKKTTAPKKRRAGTVGKLFAFEAHLENENLATEKSVTSTITDHSFATTDKTAMIAIAHSLTRTENSLQHHYEENEEIGTNKKSHSTAHSTVTATADRNKETSKKSNKASARKHGNQVLSFGGLIDINHLENFNNRGRRSSDSKNNPAPNQPSNHRTKTNKSNNHHKESEKKVLVNNILICGIAFHGIYFGACILLMVGIYKRSAGFVAPWLLTEFSRQLGVITIWGFLCYCTVDMLNRNVEDAKFTILFCAAILIVIVFTFYFWLVICSFYKDLHGKRHTVIPEQKDDEAMDSAP